MGRTSIREIDSTFTESHITRIIRSLNLKIVQETVHDYLAYCPFHNNSDTPSLSISKTTGKYLCFNPGCGERGDIMSLIKHVNSINDYEALRFIVNLRPNEQDSFEDDIASLLEHKDEFAIFDPMVINKLHNDFVNYQPAIDYMVSRSFTMETLEHFNVGWSAAKGLVTVPCYSHTNIPVGVIGRSIEGKRFKNSIGLPSSKVFFNFNRAIRTSSTAVIVESAFDAMRVHQSGWQNVIATLGGHLSPYKKDLLNRYFDRIIIMTDNDKPHYNTGRCNPCDGICKGHNPGRELGEELAQSFKRDILWAMWDDDVIYPHGAKDAGDMTDSEINTVLALAQSDFDYRLRKTIK